MLADQVVDDIAKNVIQTQLAQIQKEQGSMFLRLSRKVLKILIEHIDNFCSSESPLSSRTKFAVNFNPK